MPKKKKALTPPDQPKLFDVLKSKALVTDKSKTINPSHVKTVVHVNEKHRNCETCGTYRIQYGDQCRYCNAEGLGQHGRNFQKKMHNVLQRVNISTIWTVTEDGDKILKMFNLERDDAMKYIDNAVSEYQQNQSAELEKFEAEKDAFLMNEYQKKYLQNNNTNNL